MKKIFLLFTLILLIDVVAALDLEITPSEFTVVGEQTARFKAILSDNTTTIKNIEVYAPEIEWNIPPDTIKVYPDKDTEYDLLITPTKYIGPGVYGVKVNFKDLQTYEVIERLVQITVQPPHKAVASYRPSVSMDIGMQNNVDPSETLIVALQVENLNLLNLTGLELKVVSDLEEMVTEHIFSLSPLDKKVIELNYDLNPIQEPGTYKVGFEIWYENQLIEKTDQKIFDIDIIRPDYKEEKAETKAFIKTTSTTVYTSNSNVKDTKIVKIPSTLAKKLFLKTRPRGKSIKEDGQRFIAIDLTLQPGETKTITVTESYRGIFTIAMISLLLLIIYYSYKSPITIRKGISDIKIKEGGISELKAMLEITNSSKKTIKNVTIIDYVPNIADLSKEFVEGTLRPSQVLKHQAKGTILKWHLEEMAPGEDRLISYNLKSKLSIIGNFRLPRAKVIFKIKRKEVRSYSNSLGVNA